MSGILEITASVGMKSNCLPRQGKKKGKTKKNMSGILEITASVGMRNNCLPRRGKKKGKTKEN